MVHLQNGLEIKMSDLQVGDLVQTGTESGNISQYTIFTGKI